MGGYVEFAPETEFVEIRIGSSFIDFGQATENLSREIPAGESFAAVRSRVRDRWARSLEKVTLKGASEEDMHIFYTAFFRTLQYPREFSEYGRYYSAFDDKIHDGTSYQCLLALGHLPGPASLVVARGAGADRRHDFGAGADVPRRRMDSQVAQSLLYEYHDRHAR